MNDFKLPMVEIFETVEGEGLKAGFPTVFVRIYGCNLRCTWCDTTYSYAPAKPEFWMSPEEIVKQVESYAARHVCLTGGEPLMYGEKSVALIQTLAAIDKVEDIHIETNGAIALDLFMEQVESAKVRYIMDYKLPDSGEMHEMNTDNLKLLREQDELKFVIGSEQDFAIAKQIMHDHLIRAQILFSPVWETMPPHRLVDMILKEGLAQVKLSLQLHKVIWDPAKRGV